jgi:hypothetical protein
MLLALSGASYRSGMFGLAQDLSRSQDDGSPSWETPMGDASALPPDVDIPAHPEEMKATYNLRIGNIISLQGSARVTPAGIAAAGVTTLLVALAFAALSPKRRRR